MIKLSKRVATALGCFWAMAEVILIMLQIIFLTMKLTGAVSWSWWTTLIPIFSAIGLPIAIVVIAVIVLAPKVVIEDRRRAKRVEAEAKMYGMERKPSESTGDLKKRIVRRNMLSGNYSRKEVKDMILEAFPTVGSCQILINNQSGEIVLIPRIASTEWKAATFTDAELREIAEFAAQYTPMGYTVTAINADTKEGPPHDKSNTDNNT